MLIFIFPFAINNPIKDSRQTGDLSVLNILMVEVNINDEVNEFEKIVNEWDNGIKNQESDWILIRSADQQCCENPPSYTALEHRLAINNASKR